MTGQAIPDWPTLIPQWEVTCRYLAHYQSLFFNRSSYCLSLSHTISLFLSPLVSSVLVRHYLFLSLWALTSKQLDFCLRTSHMLPSIKEQGNWNFEHSQIDGSKWFVRRQKSTSCPETCFGQTMRCYLLRKDRTETWSVRE